MKIETKFWCKKWGARKDIEDCVCCIKRDFCELPQKYHAGIYMRRILAWFVIISFILSIGAVIWLP